jgi:UDP-galactopyranose mutase
MKAYLFCLFGILSKCSVAEEFDVVVVGCGLSGSVVAERLASQLDKKVLIVDKRGHIGGNCYDYIDDAGLLVNRYGPHIFHTRNENVWEYVNQFDEWVRWDHKVIGSVNGTLVPIPVNITTVNMLCNESISSPEEMNDWLRANQLFFPSIENSEQMAKSRVGESLYEKIFAFYTYKQWGRYPRELDPSVLARVSVRNSFDDRYFDDKYQALPKFGYTHFFKKLLASPNIEIQLNTNFFDIKDSVSYKDLVFTGPIDDYYSDLGLEKLEYRSIHFDFQTIRNSGFFQENSVVNYPDADTPFTRIVEYKHFLHQSSEFTTIVREFPTDKGEPYYPVPTQRNADLYRRYKSYANGEHSVYFIGRLGKYQYINMDQAIHQAILFFESTFRTPKE